jgi:hypothetical protein
METWLGDNHGLTDDQVGELMAISDEIYQRYCTPDPGVDDPEMVERDLAQSSEAERDGELIAAYARVRYDSESEPHDEPTTDRRMRTRVLGGGLLTLALVTLVVAVIVKQPADESAPELSLSEIVEACDGGTMIDSGTTLEIDTLVPGEPVTVQDTDTEVMCIFGQLGTSDAFRDAMHDTRAVEGQLERSEGGYHYWWWYHQDSGLHVYVSATEERS